MALFRGSHERRRRHGLERAPEGPVRDFLAVPAPSPRTPLGDLPLLAIDLETTGLDAESDRILSIGFVPVDGREIRLGGAREIVVRAGSGEGVGDSATVHGLTDDVVAAGVPLSDALAATLRALEGRVLLAHHAAIETGFLARACERAFGSRPLFVAVDTVLLGRELLAPGDEDVPPGRLRLDALRSQFGLPRYRAHNALSDALACGELYLALTQELGVTRLQQVSVR